MNITATELAQYSVFFEKEEKIFEFASEQLNKYFYKALGVRLHRNGVGAQYISLGKTRQSEKDFPPEVFANAKEGQYGVYFSNNNILINGGSPTDILRGVYGFAEKTLGVKFLSEDCELVPEQHSIRLDNDYTEKIIFPQCEYLSFFTSINFEYCLKFGFSGSFSAEKPELGIRSQWFNEIPTSHNSHCYIDFDNYKKSNPEFFAVKGESSDKFEMNFVGASSTELCYSNGINPDGTIDESKNVTLVTEVAESLYKFIVKSPQSRFFMFGRQDNRNAICHCPECVRKREKYGGESGTMIIFLNAVIRLTEKKLKENGLYRDFNIVTFAYQSTENAPVKDGRPIDKAVIPDEKLFIRYALIDSDYTYSFADAEHNVKSRQNLNKWMTLTKNLMIWDYHQCYTEYLWYFPNLNYYAENIRFFAKNGIAYLMNQGAFNTSFSWQGRIRAYMAKNLFRYPVSDEKELIKEYLSGYYGAASAAVFDFINFMEKFFAEKVEKGFRISIFGLSDNFLCGDQYPIDVLEKALFILKSGFDKIESDNITTGEKELYKRRLENVVLTPLRMIARNAEYYGEKGCVYEREFYKLADKLGLDMVGESTPYGLSLVRNCESLYKIVLPEFPTEDEIACANEISEGIKAISSVEIPIVDGNSVSPNYLEHVISIGKTMMFGEFFKNFNYERYENYIETRGKCLFVYSHNGYDGYSELLLSRLKYNVTEKDKLDVTFPFTRNFKKRGFDL